VVRIAISAEAFEAIARTLPFGSMSFENKANERGERLIWIDHAVVARLRAMRGQSRAQVSGQYLYNGVRTTSKRKCAP
jgi:hypothetical protein